MKRCYWLIAAFFCVITLISCAHTTYSSSNQNLLQEDWMRQINLNPKLWTIGADRWFFTGVDSAPLPGSLLKEVKVGQFTKVTLNGCFKVQLVGNQTKNVVFISGPSNAVRMIDVSVWGDTLIVTQIPDEKGNLVSLKNVTIRIGTGNLSQLKVYNSVHVEGRMMTSKGLDIDADNDETIILNGSINLLNVHNTGPGTISVLDTCSPCLKLMVTDGTVNVSGRVGIQSIFNAANGKINIIGADSNSFCIKAFDNSKTMIAGYVNLKTLKATGNACVNLYWVKSQNASVTVCDNARVALAGLVCNLNLMVANNGRFGGQYLHAQMIYAVTRDTAHANIAGERKIFASATQKSTIYYYGSPNNVSDNTGDQGLVLPVWTGSDALPFPSYSPQFLHMVNRPS